MTPVWTQLIAYLDADRKFKHSLFIFDRATDAEQLAATMRQKVRPDRSVSEVLAIEVEEKYVTSVSDDD